MKATFGKALAVFVGLTMANFGYDLFSDTTTWADSLEHSIFQFIAIVAMVITDFVAKKMNGERST